MAFINISRINLIILLLLFSNEISMAQQTLKILNYNVYEGFQNDSLQKETFKAWVKTFDADIITFQELNGFTHNALEDLGHSYGHPYAVLQKEQGYPVGITSKYPITDIEKRSDDFTLGYVYARILDYHLFVIHLNPFQYTKRYTQVNSILAQAARIPKKEKIMIMGDFNSASPVDSFVMDIPERLRHAAGYEKSRTGEYDDNYILNEGKFDYSVISSVHAAGFFDAFYLKNRIYASTYSSEKYSSRNGPFGRDIRIDYIWLNKTLRDRCIRFDVIKDEVTHSLSDHYPLFMELKR